MTPLTFVAHAIGVDVGPATVLAVGLPLTLVAVAVGPDLDAAAGARAVHEAAFVVPPPKLGVRANPCRASRAGERLVGGTVWA